MTRFTEIFPRGSRPWLLGAGFAATVSLAVTGLVPPLTIGPDPLPPGPLEIEVLLRTDARDGPFGSSATGAFGGRLIFLELTDAALTAGDRVVLTGRAESGFVEVAGRPHQIVDVDTVVEVKPSRSVFRHLGNGLRKTVQRATADRGEHLGLLAGFLVGDTSGVSPATQDAMKRAGLSHFVAVSGSNVAMYLSLVFIVASPFGVGVRRRAAFGLTLLPVFVVATRFEPSVIRASVMAAIVLLGKLLDVGLEFWQVLSLAVVVLLAIDPWLIRSVGFQLSVAATAGVVIGSRWPGVAPGLGRALALTLGAQILVAPLLLAHFGEIPLMSPLSNIIAAPLVSVATMFAIPGVAGVDASLETAGWAARAVIQIADAAAGWPQIGWLGLAGAVCLGWVGHLGWKVSRGATALAGAALLMLAMFAGGGQPGAGTVTVLDVGQGDAILISGGGGLFALVDGGPDEATLLQQLRSFGVDRLDLVVATHGDADHAGGLAGLFGRLPVGLIWQAGEPHRSDASDRLLAVSAAYGVPTMAPPVGATVQFGSLSIEVIGPQRRYQSPNDQSIVLLVTGAARSMLLTGDVEVVAQEELDGIRADVLKVPHHGGGTSDPEWLAGVDAALAVISVGENRFGHPVEWVVDILAESGAVVMRTDRDGSVSVDLDS